MTRRWMRVAGVVAVLPAVIASPIAAQPIESSVSAGASVVALSTIRGSELFRVEGVTASVDGRLHIGRIVLGAGYTEGRLGRATESVPFVEGYATAAIRFLDRLEVGLRPTARATRGSTEWERWVQWQVAARYEERIGITPLAAFAEGWGALSSSSEAPGERGRAVGGVAGLAWRGEGYTLLLEYEMGEARLSPFNQQTVERITLRIGIGL